MCVYTTFSLSIHPSIDNLSLFHLLGIYLGIYTNNAAIVARKQILGIVTGQNSRSHQVSWASSGFSKRSRIVHSQDGGSGQARRGTTGLKNRGFSIYYSQNEGTKYSKFKGGVIGIHSLFLMTTPSYQEVWFSCPYLALVRTVMAAQGMKIFPAHNTNKMIIHYN